MQETNLIQVKLDLVNEIRKRQNDKIIEPTNASLLTKLINNAESITEAFAIAELGTTYKRTGFHFDKRLEKIGTDIKYLERNKDLSFVNNENNNTHKLIIGDNYDSLLNLLITHKCKIDIIYIDPPYGKDDMGSFAETNYTNAITRDNLLSMLYPRLQLAKQLLSDDGVIFCSIDDKNQAYIKCLMDEIFGEENFIANMPRLTVKGGKSKVKTITNNCDWILIYAKNIYNIEFTKLSMIGNKDFKFSDRYESIRGKYHTKQALDTQSLGYVSSLDYPIEYNGQIYYPGQTPENNGFRWTWSKDLYEFAIANDFITFKEGRIFPKKYMNASIEKNKNGDYYIKIEQRKKNYSQIDLIDNLYSNTNGSSNLSNIGINSFSYPKPVDLLKTLLKLVNNSNSNILDFFAGSGTTGQAVMELNREDGGSRKFILCTNNEITESNPNGIAYDVTSKRLKRIMSGECYDGLNDFKWIKDNRPYMDNLEVYEVNTVHNSEQGKGKSPFDVIDETCYDLPEFKSIEEKISWICSSFENTQKYLEEK